MQNSTVNGMYKQNDRKVYYPTLAYHIIIGFYFLNKNLPIKFCLKPSFKMKFYLRDEHYRILASVLLPTFRTGFHNRWRTRENFHQRYFLSLHFHATKQDKKQKIWEMLSHFTKNTLREQCLWFRKSRVTFSL